MKNQKRFNTREVFIGKVAIGNNNPIRIQSMTNTKTEDEKATASQILQLYDHGCEIVRVTVQGKTQAYSLEKIKNLLLQKGCSIPIVADIHFYPPAALIAADFVEKIRINPGNYAEKRAVFKKNNLTNQQYQDEILKIEEKLFLLIEKLIKNKIALRIGVNYGSLSDRIINKYGNTINAMIISAVEYTNICRKYNFHNIVFSMKASSSFVMIEAYRALIDEMIKLKWDYPLHLGVTEAGYRENGIIKSSIGIGSLLLDGIGDTIRLSLTDDPVKEIKPARQLIKLCENRVKNKYSKVQIKDFNHKNYLAIDLEKEIVKDEQLSLIDVFYIRNINNHLIKKLKNLNKVIISKDNIKEAIKIYTLNDLEKKIDEKYVLEIFSKDNLEKLKNISKPIFIIYKSKDFHIDNIRNFVNYLKRINFFVPIIASLKYQNNLEELEILASSEIGFLLYEKLIDGIFLDTEYSNLELSLNIFQACNLKKYKTQFISCPGCGRTLFDIQKTVRNIKKEISHLPDIKIAIMGCIVNGLGEMQDVDFGYVGSLPGKIDLYVNKMCVEKNINEKDAVKKLISLIKKNKKWKKINQ